MSSLETVTVLHPVVSLAVQVMLGLSLVIAFLRALLGPWDEDRVMVLDYFTGVFICLAAFQAIRRQEDYWLQLALLLAILSFAATVALARYLDKGKGP